MSKFNNLTVLLVDDDVLQRRITKSLLKKCGITNVQEVANGKEAVDIVQNGSNFDIIFMDRDMPELNGVEATNQIRAIDASVKIFGVSSHTDISVTKDFIDAGLNGFYTKPMTTDKLTELLDGLEFE